VHLNNWIDDGSKERSNAARRKAGGRMITISP
jgi:hypothetical protein